MAKKKTAAKAPEVKAHTMDEADKIVTDFIASLSEDENFVIEIFGKGDQVQVNCNKS